MEVKIILIVMISCYYQKIQFVIYKKKSFKEKKIQLYKDLLK